MCVYGELKKSKHALHIKKKRLKRHAERRDEMKRESCAQDGRKEGQKERTDKRRLMGSDSEHRAVGKELCVFYKKIVVIMVFYEFTKLKKVEFRDTGCSLNIVFFLKILLFF